MNKSKTSDREDELSRVSVTSPNPALNVTETVSSVFQAAFRNALRLSSVCFPLLVPNSLFARPSPNSIFWLAPVSFVENINSPVSVEKPALTPAALLLIADITSSNVLSLLK